MMWSWGLKRVAAVPLQVLPHRRSLEDRASLVGAVAPHIEQPLDGRLLCPHIA